MNIVKEYKQYFTPPDLADFMVKLIPERDINTVIDLSMGECGLLEEAKKRWKRASFFGADIDETLLIKIQNKSPYINTFAGDSLGSMNTWNAYQRVLQTGGFDLAVANPPFNYFDQAAVLVGRNENLAAPIEIRFLLKYIEIIKEGGYICIILPYGFLSLDLYKELRRRILKQVTIHKIIKIFNNCFARIDADTCLLLLQKKGAAAVHTQDDITIEYLENDYSLKKQVKVKLSLKNTRLDLEYHQWMDEFLSAIH